MHKRETFCVTHNTPENCIEVTNLSHNLAENDTEVENLSHNLAENDTEAYKPLPQFNHALPLGDVPSELGRYPLKTAVSL